MDTRRCTPLIVFALIIALVGCTENYIDYGEEAAEKTAAENIRELYRILQQRNILDNIGFGGIPLEHLMTRKSQRSPSLRLRFGRSEPHTSSGALPRLVGAGAAGYDNN